MHINDHRSKFKQERELDRDRQNIMKALTTLYGVKSFNFEPDGKTHRNQGKQEQQRIRARVIGVEKTIHQVANLDPYRDIIGYVFKPFIGRGKPVVNLQVLGYGEVVYIRTQADDFRDSSSTLYVYLRDKIILKVSYENGMRSPLLWDFSLHFQNAIKEGTEHLFIENLKKDLYFYE